jgi:hypothetical protein
VCYLIKNQLLMLFRKIIHKFHLQSKSFFQKKFHANFKKTIKNI